MKFEVLRDGKVIMSTEHESCIYDKQTLKSMKESGHTFRLNGKVWNPFKTEGKKKDV